MKVIIAGGRDYRLDLNDRLWLDGLRTILPITEVVEGGASGADRDARAWAIGRGIPYRTFKADWLYGKGAGPARNRQMAEYAEACVLFPGGRGTASMRRIALAKGLPTYVREA